MPDETQDVQAAPSTATEAPVQEQTPTPEGQTATPIPEGQTDVATQPEASVDDINWKNRAMEYQRKLQETVESIPKVIQETLAQQPAVKTPEYTVEQLEVFADQTEDVQSKLWAKQKIRELERAEREREYTKLLQAEREKLSVEQRRQAVEAEVIQDQRFSDAFVVQNGRKVWNPNSNLTQLASQYIQDPALKDRPDALAIAMKLAYADVSTSRTGQVVQQLGSAKRENAQLKQQTLVEGSGVGNNIPKSDPIADAMTELSRTGSKSALRTLTQEILRRQGVIPKG
jgi:hypothetical protein